MDKVIKFSIEEINAILSALGKIPAEHSMDLIVFIKKTADEQLKSTPRDAPVEDVVAN